MTTQARREVLGLQLNTGDHVCGFYRKPAERDDILIPFLADGLKAGAKCTCVVDSCAPADVLDALSEQVGGIDTYLAGRQLEVLDAVGTYLAGGGFLPERMLQFWEAKARQSPGGPGGVTRNVGDMSWAHRKRPGVGELIGYESELNRIMGNFPQVNLCLYDLSRCTGELIMDVLKTHPKVLLGGMVIDNPYYLDPDEFLASRAG
ncbi:MAG TPA: MEDS domain-containing protein [Streptosporangiaceae bacterium]|nr:MEDS domain-containing protein [Streptosporangiaceae bacterium]